MSLMKEDMEQIQLSQYKMDKIIELQKRYGQQINMGTRIKNYSYRRDHTTGTDLGPVDDILNPVNVTMTTKNLLNRCRQRFSHKSRKEFSLSVRRMDMKKSMSKDDFEHVLQLEFFKNALMNYKRCNNGYSVEDAYMNEEVKGELARILSRYGMNAGGGISYYTKKQNG